MSLLSIGLLFGIAVACLVEFRHRGGHWLLLAPLPALGAIGALLTGNVNPQLVAHVADVPLAIVGAWFWADALGLPAPIAHRLGIGLRSWEWEYDRRLYRAIDGFREAVNRWPATGDHVAYDAWQQSALTAGEKALRRLRALSPPDAEWASLTERYDRVYAQIVDVIRAGGPLALERRDEIDREGDAILAEHERLRAVYRRRADAIRNRGSSVRRPPSEHRPVHDIATGMPILTGTAIDAEIVLADRLGSVRTVTDEAGEFDQRLSDVIAEFNAVLRDGYETRPEGAAKERLRQRAESAANAFDALTPPDDAWAQVVRDFQELAAIHLRYFGEVIPHDAQQEFAAFNHRANTRREELRQVYLRHRER